MKILQLTAPGSFSILQIPDPEPGPGEVLLRVTGVTTCPQWDIHLHRGEPMFPGQPLRFPYTPGQPGHEATGEVAALGAGVQGFALGDRVSAWRDPGHHRPGCYAELVVHRAEDLIPVPADLPVEATSPVELAMCVGSSLLLLRGMDAVRGRTFGVSGLGPAGLIACQMARAEGAARVVGFDLAESRRRLALEHGWVDEALDPRQAPEDRFPRRGQGVPQLGSSIDCVGGRASAGFLMDRTADAVALFGVQREEYTFAPRHYGGLRLCGYPGHHRAAAEYAVDLIRARRLDLRPLVTHHLPLERYAEGVDLLLRQEAIKVCFRP